MNRILSYLLVGSSLLAVGIKADPIMDELGLFEEMPVVITAAKKPQKIIEAPSTISIITAREIKHSGATKLSQLLERLPGIYTPTAHNALEMFWIRGVGRRFNDNALMLIDGVPYRTLYHSNFPINEQLPIENIERIEVIRGPGSALYGTGAFTAVINIFTKRINVTENGWFTSELGSWQLQNHSLQMGYQKPNHGASIFAKYLDANDYSAQFNDEGTATDESRQPRTKHLAGQVNYGNLEFRLRYNEHLLNDFTVVEGDEEGGITQRKTSTAQLNYNHEISESSSLQFRSYINDYKLDKSRLVSDEEAEEDEQGAFTITQEYGQVLGVEIIASHFLSEQHSLIWGLHGEYERLKQAYTKTRALDETAFELIEWATDLDGEEASEISNQNWAIYLEDELRVTPSLLLTTGVRYDSNGASRSRLSPRISLNYSLSPQSNLKFRYGEAFRAPTYQELYLHVDDGEGEGSRSLKPQTIQTSEIEWSQQFAKNQWFNLTLFNSRFENFIAVIGDGDFENQQLRDFSGIEASIHGTSSGQFSYFANLSYTRGKQANQNLGGIPKTLANFGLIYQLSDSWSLSPHLRYVSKRNKPDNYQVDVDIENRRDHLAGFWLLNLASRYQINQDLVLQFRLANLFDKTYFTPGEKFEDFDILQPGRNYKLGVEYHW